MNNDPARYTDSKGDIAFLLPLLPVIYEAVAAATVATIAYYASKDAGQAMARNSQKPSSSQDQAKKGDEANPHETSRAARRDAMREQGIPTSQPLINDKATRSKDKVYTTRDGEYTVQDAKNDVSHQGQSHWEAGKTKKDQSQPDGLNRSGNNNKPQMQQPKGKSYYGPSLFIAPIVPLVKYLLSE